MLQICIWINLLEAIGVLGSEIMEMRRNSRLFACLVVEKGRLVGISKPYEFQ